MPKKIKFKVQRMTGEDEKYRASELDDHGPSIRGWLSAKNCTFPQEITLVLEEMSILHQIQILAHHYIIPERIDVWICTDGVSSDQGRDEEQSFEYIGFIMLSNNENTRFKCRELKTITIPCSGPTKYVKLTLHENHVNNLNVHKQVGLVAVQIFGEIIATEAGSTEKVDQERSIEGNQFDDLAFEMYIDTEIALIMKQLEQKKQKAVQDERFEYARKIKITMSKLYRAGETLGKMEVAKKQAIQQEDYSKAKKKKNQIEEFRNQININLNLDNLLEKNGPLATNDEEEEKIEDKKGSSNQLLPKDEIDFTLNSSDRALSQGDFDLLKIPEPSEYANGTLNSNSTPQQNIEQQIPPSIYESPVSPIHFSDTVVSPYNDAQATTSQSNKTSSLKRHTRCPSASSRLNYDEDVNHQNYKPCFHQDMTTKDTMTISVLAQILSQSKLNEREKKQITLAVDILGKFTVEKIFSKQYADKEEGLRLLKVSLQSYIGKEKAERRMSDKTMYSFNKIARCSIYLCHRCLRDKVFAVYSAATEVIRFFFTEFVAGRVTLPEIGRCIEQILPELLSKSGDSTSRVRNLAIHTILSLAEASEVRKLNIIPNHLSRMLTANVHARLALSRLEMVEQLILSQGISPDKQSGMTCRILAEFGISGLHHPAEAVRKIAERILILVYRENPRLVRRQLPPDDDVTRRNILYRHLMQEFDKVDIERKHFTNRVHSNSRDTLKKDMPEKVIISKYSGGFGKTLNKTDSDQKSKRCVFCYLQSDTLTEKELNIHYWRYCPLLMRCFHCDQVTEIAALHQHLVEECDMKSLFRKCQICSQAVNIEQLNTHHTSVCTLMAMKKTCPLCFMELEEGDDKLRIHLTGNGEALCPKHPRSKFLSRTNE